MTNAEDRAPERTCAVVVTFHPDAEVVDRLARMRAQSEHLVVVDNGSDPATLAELRSWVAREPGTELLELGSNLGLAAALNRGLDRARALGYRLALTYDQDSVPEKGMVAELKRTLERHPNPETVAVVGPRIVDRNAPVEHYRWLRPSPTWPLLFERVSCERGYRDDVTFVITSGSLLRLEAFERLGRFREELFIDYVDHEYCLRARRQGYRILVSGEARLLHALGDKREVRVGRYSVRPTFHGSDRLYYIYRNRWPLLLRYGLREPHWLCFDVLATTHNLIRVALFEGDRLRKLRAALEGTLDGLRGRLGVRPPRHRRRAP